MARRSLSTAKRLAVFLAHGGVCEFCMGKITVGQLWEISHSVPLELGGADDETNMRPAHKKCHRTHTATVDIPDIAKAKRREAKHLGAKPKKPWSKYRKRMDGTVVAREP